MWAGGSSEISYHVKQSGKKDTCYIVTEYGLAIINSCLLIFPSTEKQIFTLLLLCKQLPNIQQSRDPQTFQCPYCYPRDMAPETTQSFPPYDLYFLTQLTILCGSPELTNFSVC